MRKEERALNIIILETTNPAQAGNCGVSEYGHAHPLLSSKNDSWISKSNLPSTCSELIAQQTMENLILTHNRDHMVLHETHSWGPMNDVTGNLTLNLMHIGNSEFRLFPKEETLEEEGCQLQQQYNSLARAHIS